MTHRAHYSGQQTGFALIAALFMIVVLAALGIFAIRVSSSQQQSINTALLMARASAMANTGLEYGSNQALKNNSCGNWILNQPELNGFTIKINCTMSNPTVNGSAAINPKCVSDKCPVFELDSTATYSQFGQPDFVSRKVSRTVSQVPVP